MTRWTLARPGPDESATWLHGYIDAVPDEAIGDRLVTQLDDLERLLQPLDDAAARARYAEGKWSVKEVIGHLIDAERIFAYRLLRLSRGDATPLPGFDENAYVAAAQFDARALPDLTAELRGVRLSTLTLVRNVQPERWSFRGQSNGQPITARALAYVIVGHVAHHATILQTRYNLGARTS